MRAFHFLGLWYHHSLFEIAMSHRVLVTGGAGFIGSAVVRNVIEESSHEVCVVDKLTYA